MSPSAAVVFDAHGTLLDTVPSLPPPRRDSRAPACVAFVAEPRPTA